MENLMKVAEEIIEDEGESITMKELEKRLTAYARLLLRALWFNPPRMIIPVAINTVLRLIEQGKKLEINDAKILQLCNDEDKLRRVYSKALDILKQRGMRYAVRLTEVEEKAVKEADPWPAVYKIYDDVAKEFTERIWKLVEEAYANGKLRITNHNDNAK